MLPTEDKTTVRYNSSLDIISSKISDYAVKTDAHLSYQHLYIVSDDEIKEGHWCYDIELKRVFQAHKNLKQDVFKKIIATTDKLLTVKKPLYSGYLDQRSQNGYYDDNLPEPSQGFIKKYCEKRGIDKVMVEYDNNLRCYKCGKSEADCIATSSNCIGYYKETYQLKVSSDNTITIKPIKDSWNREEVTELLEELFYDASQEKDGFYREYDSLEDWIKQNL